MNNPITAATIASIGAPAPAQTVTVTWANGTRANYSADMLDALKTDPAALDIQDDSTGEIIYIKPDSTEAATQAAEGTDEKKKVETMTRQKLYTAITAAGIVLHPCNAAETVPEGGDVIYYLTTKELTGIYADITEEREAAETRAAIKATQEAQEAPQEAPAAEAEQQPTTTEREALERINARQNAANLFTNITAADIAREIETMNDEQKEEEKPMSNTIERYDYMEHMTADVIDAIRERYTPDEIRERLDDDRDDFAQELNDDLWIDDSVTGNASGSYYCNAWRAEAAIHAATVAGIIRRNGGYRERDLLNHPHTIERGTWTTEHKVVEILATTPDPDGYRPGCAVDLVTRSIVG